MKAIYGKSKQEAKKRLKEFLNDPANQPPGENARTSLLEYIESWLVTFQKVKLKPSSYGRLESTIRIYVVPNLGMILLKDIAATDIQKLLNKLLECGLSYSSIKKVYDAINACLKHAVLSRTIRFNPCDTVSLPSKEKFERKKIRAFSEEEVKRIFQEAEAPMIRQVNQSIKYCEVFRLNLNTGIRIGEAIALDWDDVSFENKTITVSKNAIYVKDRDKDGVFSKNYSLIIQNTLKSRSGNRVVPQNKIALEALTRLKNANENSKIVLTTAQGTRTKYHTISWQFDNILKECGISGVGIHALRHTFATRLFEKGADVKTVSVLLVHSSTAITYNTYIHVIQSKKEDVVSLLES